MTSIKQSTAVLYKIRCVKCELKFNARLRDPLIPNCDCDFKCFHYPAKENRKCLSGFEKNTKRGP